LEDLKYRKTPFFLWFLNSFAKKFSFYLLKNKYFYFFKTKNPNPLVQSVLITLLPLLITQV
jgi:hypothetical protein